MSQVAGLEEFLNDQNGCLGVANNFSRPLKRNPAGFLFRVASFISRCLVDLLPFHVAALIFYAMYYQHHFLVKATKVSIYLVI